MGEGDMISVRAGAVGRSPFQLKLVVWFGTRTAVVPRFQGWHPLEPDNEYHFTFVLHVEFEGRLRVVRGTRAAFPCWALGSFLD